MNATIELRQACSLPTLMRWRIEVLEKVYGTTPHPRLLVANRRYFRAHADDGTLMTLVAVLDGTECGCGTLCFTDVPPSPANPAGRCAIITCIYVREPFRGRGIARAIMRRLVDEARARQCGEIHHSTPETPQ